MTSDEADKVISYIEALEERVNHNTIMHDLMEKGYTEIEIDSALKALGKIAGRDCGIV